MTDCEICPGNAVVLQNTRTYSQLVCTILHQRHVQQSLRTARRTVFRHSTQGSPCC